MYDDQNFNFDNYGADVIPDSANTSSPSDLSDYDYGDPDLLVNNDTSSYYGDNTFEYPGNPYGGETTYYGTGELTDAEKAELAKQTNPSVRQFISDTVNKLGDKAGAFLKNYLYDPKTGKLNLAGIVTGVTALKALSGGDTPKSTAYQGKIPNLTAVTQAINYQDPNRRPGESGRRYFTGTQYVTPENVAAAESASQAKAAGILSGYKPKETPEVNPYAGTFAMKFATPMSGAGNVTTSPASGVRSLLPVPEASATMNEGFAGGGMAQGRYLKGATDGMADEIPSSIDGKQKAALSHGEFVIPADVVSHLGNGNSDAGAKKLYEMMARVRKARTGNAEQGKKINPNQFMPGGQVGYAAGGIAKFAGTDGSLVGSSGTTGPATTGVSTPAIPKQGESVATNLSGWAGPYVSDYLGKGQALSNMPYQAYTGPLTAGPSQLQQQQYAGLSDIAKTGYTPGQFTGGIFDTAAAQQYMNPYLSAALDPQLAELRRQGQITNLGNQAQATKMGVFGGSGSTLMQTETQRNVLDKMQQALGQGYNTAYDKAMAQYNADQQRRIQAAQDEESSRQFGANFGLKTLQDLGAAGATQRDIAQQGITADKAQFEEERDFPYKQVQFQKSLLTGLPITTTDTTPMQSDISKISAQIQGLASLYQLLAGLGQTQPK